MKRLSMLITATLAAIAVAVVLAAGGSAQDPGEQTIKLVERPGTEAMIDNPPTGDRNSRRLSAGDISIQTVPLFDESNTRRLGTGHVECIATRGGTLARVTFHCSGTYKLADGTLAFDFAGGVGTTITLAITGGTGAYHGRDGSALTVERANTNLTDHTIRLTP